MTTPAIVPPTMAPMLGPSLFAGFVVTVAPDRAFLTQEAETQLLQSPSAVTQSSSTAHLGHIGAAFSHCTQRLNRDCEGEKSSTIKGSVSSWPASYGSRRQTHQKDWSPCWR